MYILNSFQLKSYSVFYLIAQHNCSISGYIMYIVQCQMAIHLKQPKFSEIDFPS